jgi:hypothetical protein
MARYTIFQAELESHLAVGEPYYVAKQNAIDYHRQFTRREETDIWWWEDQYRDLVIVKKGTPDDSLVMGESRILEANLSPESRTLFNDLARELFFRFVEESENPNFARMYVCRLFRMLNFEHILDEDLQRIVQENLGKNDPRLLYEFSSLVGFPLRKKKRTSSDFEISFQRIETELKIFTKTML